MKAKKINEVQNFERTSSPKKALDLGGIILASDLEKRIEKFNNDKKELIANANEEWNSILEKTFLGKTITATLQKLPKISTVTGNVEGKSETREFTITVKDILVTNNPFEERISSNIIIADEENNIYSLRDLNKKIYFK